MYDFPTGVLALPSDKFDLLGNLLTADFVFVDFISAFDLGGANDLLAVNGCSLGREAEVAVCLPKPAIQFFESYNKLCISGEESCVLHLLCI